jgi:ornithine cyclodeaminase/alanine dehydrogenase-like protein (mu-crystallin family)
MPAIYLTESDVHELMDMPTAIEVIEEAFRELGQANARNVPRARAIGSGIGLHTLSASADYLGVVGWKAYTTTRSGARFLVAIYDGETGEMQALMEADYLGQLRTGAASGVATEYMARPDAALVGIFGTGSQARTQLEAICRVRKIERVAAYSRNDERRRKFATEMSARCQTEVVAVHAPEEAAAEKDIVICATTSKTPLFDGRVLEEGTHLNVVGSNYFTKAEIDVTTVRRADVIVCDSIEQCKLEAGDFREALETGVTDWALMHELSDVVCGEETGRAKPEQITLFKSVGLGLEDVALAAKIIERARDADIGKPLPF